MQSFCRSFVILSLMIVASSCGKRDSNTELRSIAIALSSKLQEELKPPYDFQTPPMQVGSKSIPAQTMRERFIYDGKFDSQLAMDTSTPSGIVKIELAEEIDPLDTEGQPTGTGRLSKLITINAHFEAGGDGKWVLVAAPCTGTFENDPKNTWNSDLTKPQQNDELATRFVRAATNAVKQ